MAKPSEVEKRTDPFGKVFETQKLMCEHYGVTPSLLRQRLGRGWTFRQTLNLDEPPKRYTIKCPLGKTFASKEAMVKHYNVVVKEYYRKIKDGWTERQALNIDPKPGSLTCPNGKVFATIKDMTEYYNVPYNSFRSRRRRGWSLKQCLGLEEPPRSIRCPKGILFTNVLEMCKHYGITQAHYSLSIAKGLTLEQILSIENKPKPFDTSITCPNGLQFSSKAAMCAHYGVKFTTYRNRIDTGWTGRQALNIDPPPELKTTVFCPNGLRFENKKDMCTHYGLDYSKYKYRISYYNWNERQALGIDPPPIKVSKGLTEKETQLNNEKLCVLQKEKKLNGVQFYLTQDKETLKNYVLTEEQIKSYPSCLQVFKKL